MKKYSNLLTILGAILLLVPHFAANIIGVILILLVFLKGKATKGVRKGSKFVLGLALVISVLVALLGLLPGVSSVRLLGVSTIAAGSTQFILVVVSFVLLSLKK